MLVLIWSLIFKQYTACVVSHHKNFKVFLLNYSHSAHANSPTKLNGCPDGTIPTVLPKGKQCGSAACGLDFQKSFKSLY